MKSICVGLLIISGMIASARGEGIRTDINPALRYWEAFMMTQNVKQAIRDQLNTNEWRGQPLPANFEELVSAYNQQFRLIRAAAKSETPCDWGLDLSEGPESLLPHLAVAKGLSRVARLRAMWDLQNKKPDEARDDLLATLALARNVSRDGVLISAIVQIAMENILISTVAENFYQFPPETLKQLEDGFESAPARGTVAQAVTTGERWFYTWFVQKVQDARKQHPRDEAAAMADIRAIFRKVLTSGDEKNPSDPTDKMLEAAGGTSEGLLTLLGELPPVYDRATAILALPRKEYEAQIGPFEAEIKASRNPFITELFPSLIKCRQRELVIQAKLAMLRAAVKYKLGGDTGFNSVIDPLGDGPFLRQRFVFAGVDRGFQLKSAYGGQIFPEVMIFVEKAGTPFVVDGKHAGEAAPKPDGK